MHKHYLTDGEEITQEVAYSEVAMHMQVAGKVMRMRYKAGVPSWKTSVQLLNDDGSRFSSPILPGEAGVFYDDTGYYVNQPDPPDYSHAFKTFLGLPPSTDDQPICGATLPTDWTGKNKPMCPTCETAMQTIEAKEADSD